MAPHEEDLKYQDRQSKIVMIFGTLDAIEPSALQFWWRVLWRTYLAQKFLVSRNYLK